MFRKSILGIAVIVFFFNFKVYAQGYEVPQISIFPDLTGNELLDAVANAYRPTQVYSYNDSRDFMFSQTHNLDGVVYCLYTNDVILIPYNDPAPRTIANAHNPTWNTEHVYPQSKGASAQPAQSDMHHLFPTRSDVNSSRGNLPFGLVANNQVSRWWREGVSQANQPAGDLGEWSKTSGSVRFEPRDATKGDVARAVFYFYTMYKAQAEAADPVFFQVMYEDLRVFHNMDPVDSLEYHRTLAIGNIQNHQGNPFILDTTLVTRMFFAGDIEFENEIEEGDYLVNFEAETKGSYAAAPISLSGVTWNLDNVLIGNIDGDLKIGARSARLRHNTTTPATMEMLDLLPGGIGTVSFVYGLYQSDLDPISPTFIVEYTTDASSGSANWTQLGDPVSLAGVNTFQEFRFDLQQPSPARIRIRSTSGTEGRRFNIDNIFITRVVEQSVNQTVEGVPGWRMLASPTQSTTFSHLLEGTFFTQGFPGADAPSETYGSNVLLYNEASGQFVSPTSINDKIATAQGFVVVVYPEEPSGTTVQKILSRTGFENAEIALPLSFTSDGGNGWNLVGNPFAAPYPVSALGISAGDINQNLYVWDANLDDYVVYCAIDQAATIAPFQSFFVKAESAGQTLNFNRNERTEGGVFHKTPTATDGSISEITNSNALPFQITLTMGDFTGNLTIHFDADGTANFSRRDAYRLPPWNSSYVYPYVEKSGVAVSGAYFPLESADLFQIPLFLRSSASGEATLSVGNVPASYRVRLENMDTNEMIILSNAPATIALVADSLRTDANAKMPSNYPVVYSVLDIADFSTPYRLHVEKTSTSITNEPGIALPETLVLEQNYPNPFNPVTTISFTLTADAAAAPVRLTIYDLLGRQLATVVDAQLATGTHRASFDASMLASGTYVYRLETASGTITRKMTLMK